MSDARELLLELNELTREVRGMMSEGVPGSTQALNYAEQLREDASQAIRAGRRGEKDKRAQDARKSRREDLAKRLAAISTRLDEIDSLIL